MSQLIVLLAMVFSILIAIFAVQNTTQVAVSFLTFQAQSVAVSVLVLIAAAVGALTILLLGAAREVSMRWRHRAVAQQLKAAQARIAELEASSRQQSAVSSSQPSAVTQSELPATPARAPSPEATTKT